MDYISRAAALMDFEACNARNPKWLPQRVKSLLLRQHDEDVEEIVHARWVDVYNDFTVAHCSNCGAEFDVADEGKGTAAGWARFKNRYKSCPGCRAMMDGGMGDG